MSRNQLHIILILGAILQRISAQSCLLYLAPSTVPESGRGLFAGVQLDGNSTFSEDTSIILHEAHSYTGGLRNYVHQIADTDHVALHLGAINFINSASSGSVSCAWLLDDSPPHGMSLPYSDFYPRATYSRRVVLAGEELFANYGAEWFENRHLLSQTTISSQLDVSTLQHIGACISDVHVSASNIPAAHLGLFANRKFEAGDLITVSPVLLLRMKNIEVTKSTSSLLNYMLTEAGAPVGLLPLGNVAMINHAQEDQSNVFIAWFDWAEKLRASSAQEHNTAYAEKCISKDSTVEQLLQESVDDLISYPFAALDIAFYAKRPINVGEELFLNYGPAWSSFVSRCVDPASQKLIADDECLHYRHPIELPTGLFPRHWYDDSQQQVRTTSTETSSENKQQNNNPVTAHESNENANDINNSDKPAEEGFGNRFSSMFNNFFRRK